MVRSHAGGADPTCGRFTQVKSSGAFGARSARDATKIMGIIPIVRDARA
jgi:hypothetical protein